MSTQIRSNGFMPALLHSCIGTISWTPSECTQSTSSHVTQPTQDIFGQVPTVDIIPVFSSFFQNLIILIILLELFTKRLQNLRNQFWRVCVQQRSLHLRVHPVSLPNFLCMLFKVALQDYFDAPTACAETRCFPYALDSRKRKRNRKEKRKQKKKKEKGKKKKGIKKKEEKKKDKRKRKKKKEKRKKKEEKKKKKRKKRKTKQKKRKRNKEKRKKKKEKKGKKKTSPFTK